MLKVKQGDMNTATLRRSLPQTTPETTFIHCLVTFFRSEAVFNLTSIFLAQKEIVCDRDSKLYKKVFKKHKSVSGLEKRKKGSYCTQQRPAPVYPGQFCFSSDSADNLSGVLQSIKLPERQMPLLVFINAK